MQWWMNALVWVLASSLVGLSVIGSYFCAHHRYVVCKEYMPMQFLLVISALAPLLCVVAYRLHISKVSEVDGS